MGIAPLATHIRPLTTIEVGYIAGLVDGEGSVLLVKTAGAFRAPGVSVASNDVPVVEWLRDVVGCGRIAMKRPRKETHQIGYSWEIKNLRAIELLTVVAPFLLVPRKRRRADLIVSEYASLTKRNGYYSAPEREAKSDFERRFFEV